MGATKVSPSLADEIKNRLLAHERPAHIARDLGLYPGVVGRIRDASNIPKFNQQYLPYLLRVGFKKGDLGFLNDAGQEFLEWLIKRHPRVLSFSDMINAELKMLYAGRKE